MQQDRAQHEAVREYYGRELQGSADLKTDACCAVGAFPAWVRPLLANVHEEVTSRFYGCGLLLPEALEGATVLDLGCGTGRDVYLLAQLVGPEGRVIGVDMTPEQLDVARRTLPWHMERFGFPEPNVAFHEGVIEGLEDLPVAPGSVDVIVSNCVINLVTDKAAVLRGAHRLLKTGGEMHFSDVYADRRLPEALKADPVLYGECLSGALYIRDFERLAQEAGFAAPRLITGRQLEIGEAALAAKLGEARFFAMDFRLFKLSDRPGAEDYGDRATYAGGLQGQEAALVLDRETVLPAGEAVAVSAETALILAESRLSAHVTVTPGDGIHRGAFGGGEIVLPEPAGRVGGCCG